MAYIIDAIILQIAAMIVGAIFGLGIGAGAMVLNTSQDSASSVSALGGGLLGILISWLYSAFFESSSMQATLGKKALGLAVTDEDGGRIGFGRATGRYLAKILSGLILGFGYFMIGWTDRKRGLHDMLAGTLVYKARDPRSVMTGAAVFE